MTVLRLALLLILIFTGSLASAQNAYRVRAGDTLRVEVIEDPTLNRSLLVSPDGRITMPLAGSIKAAGRSVEAIRASLSSALSDSFAAPPNVYVAVEKLVQPKPAAPPAPPPTIEIYVLGEVGRPGLLEVSPGTTVLQLFAQMGGFTGFAATKRIQLRRTGPNGQETVYRLNYDAMVAGQSPNGTATIQEGDVLIVPQRRLFE